MNHYTTLAGQLKEQILTFSEKLCVGISRPKLKFVAQMLFGILKGQSVMLTDIARALCEDITLKKTVDRLSRNCTKFNDREKLTENYTETVKPIIDEDTIYCLDPGELVKDYSRKQGGLCKVWDSSEKKGAKGYNLVEVTALTHKTKLPVPIYTELYSSENGDSEGETAEIIKAINHINDNFGNKGILTKDRGMDCVEIYQQCHNNGQKFVVRAKKNRNVIYNGETLNILDLANKFKGKIKLDHTDKHGKKHTLKMWHIPIELPDLIGVPLTLIVVHGYDKKDPEPMLLITNLDAAGKQKSLRVLKTYLCRWRIEEYYRFKKNQFDLENIRVMSLESIKTLNLLVSILSGWLAMFAAKRGQSLLLERIFVEAKRVYEIPQFTLYAVADGIYEIFSKTFTGISYAFARKPQSGQLTLLEPSRIQPWAA